MSPQFDKTLLKSCGIDTFLSQNIEIRRPQLVSVGNHSAIDSGFYCTTAAEIGDYVHVGPYVTVIGGAKGLLRMNHFATLAAGCRIICGSDNHQGDGLVGPAIPDSFKDSLTIAPVILEQFANVGTNVIIMPGVTIAEGCVVGAGAIVNKSTEPWMIYIGSPARPIKIRPKDKMLQFAKELGFS